MTGKVHVKHMSQARRLQQNVERSAGQGKTKRHESPRKVVIHVAPDVSDLAVAALAALAMRVMKMGDGELREFIKRVRRS
jgi:hypothetical protein